MDNKFGVEQAEAEEDITKEKVMNLAWTPRDLGTHSTPVFMRMLPPNCALGKFVHLTKY